MNIIVIKSDNKILSLEKRINLHRTAISCLKTSKVSSEDLEFIESKLKSAESALTASKSFRKAYEAALTASKEFIESSDKFLEALDAQHNNIKDSFRKASKSALIASEKFFESANKHLETSDKYLINSENSLKESENKFQSIEV